MELRKGRARVLMEYYEFMKVHKVKSSKLSFSKNKQTNKQTNRALNLSSLDWTGQDSRVPAQSLVSGLFLLSWLHLHSATCVHFHFTLIELRCSWILLVTLYRQFLTSFSGSVWSMPSRQISLEKNSSGTHMLSSRFTTDNFLYL
jgi:hypothetical protein